MEENKNIENIFCANEQAVTPHEGVVDENGEFLFTCLGVLEDGTPCGRFLKFPSETTPEVFDELLDKHEETNTGQVNIEVQQKKLDTLLNRVRKDKAATEEVVTSEVPDVA